MNQTQTPVVPALTLRRTFKAPRAKVFAAWTQPELLRKWFGPPGATVTAAECDPREGGKYRIAMTNSEGEEYVVGGVFTEVRAPARLAYTFRWEEDDPALERDTLITLEFHERGAETELIFNQVGFRDETSRARHEDGWNGSLGQLGAML